MSHEIVIRKMVVLVKGGRGDNNRPACLRSKRTKLVKEHQHIM